jgi:UDP-N-acetylmuramoyl-tripeptide--D-alanyl-D-alanine ligase
MRISLKHPERFAAVFELVTKNKLFRPITGITTDSRETKNGDLYIALEGENFDGHNFINQVDKSGAVAALVSKNFDGLDIQQIKVANPLIEIGKIAKEWRLRFDFPVIAITGSNGKTSTKELLLHVLSDDFNVHATEGNFNTHIGLPLTLLQMNVTHNISILEMGASVPGEIEGLCDIARPTHGLITNIATAHLEGFGSIENIAHEKGALFRSLESNGTAFFNKTDDMINNISYKGKKVTFGLTPDCDFPADIYQKEDGTLAFILDTHEIHTGTHNLSFIKNSIAVSALAITLGVDWDVLKTKLLSFTAPPGRCNVIHCNGVTIINDTYNANLASSLAAIDYLNAFSGNGRRILVFGDMFELGTSSNEQHRRIGQKCSELNLDGVYTIGEHTKHTDSAISNVVDHSHYKSKDNLITSLKKKIIAGDKILFKGSRGMKMEKVIAGVFDL